MATDSDPAISDEPPSPTKTRRLNPGLVVVVIAVVALAAGLVGYGSASSSAEEIELPARCQQAAVVDDGDVEECLRFLQRENSFLEDENDDLEEDLQEVRGELDSAERLLADVEYALSQLELLCYEMGRC